MLSIVFITSGGEWHVVIADQLTVLGNIKHGGEKDSLV
jgi:hypothetical protein